MRSIALITVSMLLVLLPFFLKDGMSVEQVDHHGQMVDDSGDPIDCIVCHDGMIAPESHPCIVECGFGGSHPILKEYPPSMKESSYAPAGSLLAKGIRLFNGKLSCVSCHHLKNATKYHLVMDNSNSALCFSCHIN